jgi:hypothetical protein
MLVEYATILDENIIQMIFDEAQPISPIQKTYEKFTEYRRIIQEYGKL